LMILNERNLIKFYFIDSDWIIRFGL
jgi:hypothetical protein